MFVSYSAWVWATTALVIVFLVVVFMFIKRR